MVKSFITLAPGINTSCFHGLGVCLSTVILCLMFVDQCNSTCCALLIKAYRGSFEKIYKLKFLFKKALEDIAMSSFLQLKNQKHLVIHKTCYSIAV